MARGAEVKLRVGSVIRYAYLWADESRRGLEEGQKDRPSLVVAIAVEEADRSLKVLALAMTHAPPREAADAIAVPNGVKLRLGLDERPTWIVTSEANLFYWPGPDLRPIPGRRPSTAIYGQVPGDLLRKTVQSYLANRRRRMGRVVVRTS